MCEWKIWQCSVEQGKAGQQRVGTIKLTASGWRPGKPVW
ncbi:expressed unknown protein [Ectocarpus siliculosus]|uniref:Uncharacterized protein n=1 Tax=Ectocarpus siliculosus TaxID=2880 RepID=D8LLK3_ECTSI|nr:expressed unknown protein [Ectocarpus siliculosus]|eukprot:CBN74634.1 expressed unknown protein [Ectocarpus siliculosus]